MGRSALVARLQSDGTITLEGALRLCFREWSGPYPMNPTVMLGRARLLADGEGEEGGHGAVPAVIRLIVDLMARALRGL